MTQDITSSWAQHKVKIAVLAVIVIAVLAFLLLGGDDATAPAQKMAQTSSQQELSDAPAQAQPTEAWLTRCEEPQEGTETTTPYCEVFQALVMQETNQRFAEFAVGFPQDASEKGIARGVIVLPLGILLTDGIQMQIDDGQKYKFQVRYCGNNGCFAFVNLNKGLLDELRKGSETKIIAKATTGQDMIIKMTLKGFKKALQKIS